MLTRARAHSLWLRRQLLWRVALDRVSEKKQEATLKAAQPIWSTLAKPTQQDFVNLVRLSRIDLQALAEMLANKQIDARTWAEHFKRILNRDHMHAWAMGRQRAGDTNPLDFMDALAGVAKADEESDFLLSFLDALEDGDKRYFDEDGNLRTDQVFRRSKMYTGAYRGTANEAFAQKSPDEAEIYWRLGGVEEHCGDCPEMVPLNPFTKDTLFQVPGDNQTPCLFNCKCYLETIVDGESETGFKPLK